MVCHYNVTINFLIFFSLKDEAASPTACVQPTLSDVADADESDVECMSCST